MDRHQDAAFRNQALLALDEILDASGPTVTRAQLRNLDLDVPTPHLVDRQKGIWNPSWLLATLSVVTVKDGPYPDKEIADGLWEYRYRHGGTEGDNRKLQRAADLEVDVIYFRETETGRYTPIFPVRVIDNDPIEGKVLLARKDFDRISWSDNQESVSESLRSWAVREVKVRLHQAKFRETVITAYDHRCAICELPIDSLLDAAHIDPFSSALSSSAVANGIALCKLHHYAFDGNVIGISASRRVHVAERVLRLDGPKMLDDGIKAFHGARLLVPQREADQPAPDRLKRRWDEFKQVPATASSEPGE